MRQPSPTRCLGAAGPARRSGAHRPGPRRRPLGPLAPRALSAGQEPQPCCCLRVVRGRENRTGAWRPTMAKWSERIKNKPPRRCCSRSRLHTESLRWAEWERIGAHLTIMNSSSGNLQQDGLVQACPRTRQRPSASGKRACRHSAVLESVAWHRHALLTGACRLTAGRRPGLCRPAWWAPRGFAAIPTTALDPPLVRRLPRSPRLSGPGPHRDGRPRPTNRLRPRRCPPPRSSETLPASRADAAAASARCGRSPRASQHTHAREQAAGGRARRTAQRP